MRRRRRPTQGSPPTQECIAICPKAARFHALQAALTKPLVFSQQIFMGRSQGAKLCQAQCGQGARKYRLHPCPPGGKA